MGYAYKTTVQPIYIAYRSTGVPSSRYHVIAGTWMKSSMTATHLNSAGNRTKTVTLSLLTKIMALNTPGAQKNNIIRSCCEENLATNSTHRICL